MYLTTVDTTLRDGEQSAGVVFSKDQKVEIAKSLDMLGIDIIEAGIPVMGIDEQQAIYDILGLNLSSDILTWNRMNIKDVDASIETGAKHTHISVPMSDLHIYKKLKIDRDELVQRYLAILEYSLSKGLEVSIGAEDASRADENFLIYMFTLAIKKGVKRIRYADTVSVLDPFTSFERIERIKNRIIDETGNQFSIDFHGHNDFGLGTANALGAFKAGADTISCSVNGLGERAGNTPLEEIVMALKMMEGVTTNVRCDKLVEVSELVETYSGRMLQGHKPIVGKMVFSHEAGIHVDGLLKDRRTYEYLNPRILGRKHQIVSGKHSGKNKISLVL